jgi:predicted Zn-dependent protease
MPTLGPGRPIPRRAALALLGAWASGCASTGLSDGLKRLTGGGDDPAGGGRMVQRYARRPFDPAAMRAEQERVLRLQRAEAAYGLVYLPELHDYLDRVALRVVRTSPAPEVAVRVLLVTSRDWAANATPPGVIFLPMGLVEQLDNEDELAFVLAHEIAHVLLRHHESDWLVESQRQAIALGELAMAARTALAPQTARADSVTPATLGAAKAVLVVSDRMIAPAWTRTQERQADLIACDLLVAAGYNPGAAVEVLRKLAAWRKAAGQSYQPAPREPRRDTQSPQRRRSGSGGLEPNWDSIAATLQSGFEGLAQTHPDPEERLTVAQAYLVREYADLDPVDVTVGPWRAVRGRPGVREVFTRYGRAFEARARLRDRDLREAQRLAQEAVQGVAATHNFPRFTLAEVQWLAGRRDQAVEHLRVALRAPEPALESYLVLASLHERSGRPAEALAVLERAREPFADHPRTWPHLIRLYRRTRRSEDAARLELRCRIELADQRELCEGRARP